MHGLQNFLAEYEQRTNTHQFALVAPLIAEDAVYWFSSGSYRGLAEIQAAFEGTWKFIQGEIYTISEIGWLAVDEGCAAAIYRYHWQGTINGQRSQGFGRGTNIFRRADGVWRIVHEHLSPLPKT